MAAPWLRDAWLRLVNAYESNRLAHAYYLKHNLAHGSNRFIEQFTKYLLCQAKGKSACNQCKSCLLYAAGNHPDTWTLDGDETSRIGVDEIRDLQKNIVNKANQGGFKVAVILQAEKMTEQASNALLKVLEEPPEDTCWLVSTKQPEQLLPTLRSRMQWLNIPYPEAAQTEEQTAQAAELFDALHKLAPLPELKDKAIAADWLMLSERLVSDMLAELNRLPEERFYFPDLLDNYKRLVQCPWLDARHLSEWVSECRQLRQIYQGSPGINLALLLILAWSRWSNFLLGEE
ncbi:DNA polymerase III subunit delta' [Idiomarina sp. X4]|uniref:hypothetical protein n=1 Tax=Idiomarina sp. X4 TaxID=2055892 RepID=UPI000C28BACB|nr:hypothetical protein [Idiomarina sp. X4]ATZ74317.1 DNA polymerase III subunit delta' [Idiomarina sp. X4]